MADKDRAITIKAEPDGNPNGVKFGMFYEGVGTDNLEFSKDKDGMKKSEHYKLTLTLNDTSGLNLRFVSKRADAMWVHKIADPSSYQCPPPNSHLDGFAATHVTDTEITIQNKDEDVEFLAFALNFVKDGDDDKNPANYIQYDPIVTNKNGGTNMEAKVVVIAAVVAVVAIAALVALTGM